MKKIAKILCVLLAVCMALSFGACKKKQADAGSSTELPTETGSIYYLSGCRYGEEIYTLDQLQIYDPEQTYIYFDGQGTGTLCIDGWETYFEYADGQLWEEFTPDEKVNYSISGDALTLEQEGYTMVFTQGELPEWALPQEDAEEIPEETPEEIVQEGAPSGTN